MGRPRMTKHAAPAEIELGKISQEVPEEEPEEEGEAGTADEPQAGGKAISKAKAVREALSRGKEGLEEGTDYIKSRYGIEISRQMFSSYKSQQKARDAKKQGDARPGAKAWEHAPKSRAMPPPDMSKAAIPFGSSPGGIIADIEDIRRLVGTHGKDGLKRLLDIL